MSDTATEFRDKRREVAGCMARARVTDATSCTSIYSELYELMLNGFVGTVDWVEDELDEYLRTHDAEGQPHEENKSDVGLS